MSPSSEIAARLEKMASARECIAQDRQQEAYISESNGFGALAKIERQLSEEHAKVAADLRAAAQAVRAMEWRPIREAKQLGVERCIVGRWVRGKTWFEKETAFLNVAIEDGYTHYFIVPAPPEVGG